ncbi:MAG: hypothetical protein CM1200mP16_02570 [Nitrospina sp.]|nr:MAG: hypothetical protein CM1200mP16_02570 [Nitrospina sp.]
MESKLILLREKIKSYLMQDHNMLILAALIGFFAGLASTAFRWMIEFFGIVFSLKDYQGFGDHGTAIPFLMPLMPMFGGIITGVICHFFPDAVKKMGCTG